MRPTQTVLSTGILLGLAVAALVTLWPFLRSGGTSAAPYAFEVELRVERTAHAQLYFDNGRGLNEADSVRRAVLPDDGFQPLRFPLETGTYRHLRFDPSDAPGPVALRGARVVGPGGRVVRAFTPADFVAQHQIATATAQGDVLEVTVASPGNDPNLGLVLPEPLVLAESLPGAVRILLRAGIVAAVLGGLLLLVAQVGRRKQIRPPSALVRARTFLGANPARAVALVAFAAVITSSYPIVFLGKSHVSPHFTDGTYLLYDGFPTLPGTSEMATEDAKGADVGAVFWQFIPFGFMQHRALLHDGELPLWNRYNSSGTVLFAQGQSMFGDPLHLLVALAGGHAWAWDLKYLAAKFSLCLALGLIVLHGTRHLPAAALTAFSAAFLGFFIYRLNHSAYFSFCYAPWILYAWVRLSDATTLRQTGAWCGALLLANGWVMHSGTIKEAYMLLFGLNLSGVLVLLGAARPWRDRLKVLAAASWTGALFVLLTAPSWLTFMDALGRAYTSYNAATAYQIRPDFLLGLFDEIFYRPLQRGERVSNPSANFVVLLGVLYFLAAFRHAARSRLARAIAWSALVPLALAFGLVPPQWIVQVPFLANVAHIDNSFSCVLILLLVVLAGFGWRAAAERLGTPEGRHDLVRIAWAGFALGFLWVAFLQTVHRPIFGTTQVVSLLQWGQRVPAGAFVWASLGILTLAAVGLLLTLRLVLSGRCAVAPGALWLTIFLGLLLWRHGVHAPGVGPADYVFTPTARMDFDAPSPAVAAVQADQQEPGRVVGLRGNLFPGWSGVYGLEGINGPDALINPAYRELTEAIGLERMWDWRIYISEDNLVRQKPALDFLNVRHYLATPGELPVLRKHLAFVARADLDVFRSREAWPRAFFAATVVSYDAPAEIGQRLRAAPGQPFAAVHTLDLGAEPGLSALANVGPSATVVPATAYELTSNRTRFTVDAPGPGVAVLHEAWLRDDFRATLNGETVPYVRVNHAFKGVIIPAAGRHEIEFAYWPRRLSLAFGLSGAGLVLALLSGAVVLKWPRPAPRP